MNKRLIAPIVAALTIALIAAAGCGGGGDDGTASITKAEFVKQANAVCGKAQKQLESGLQAFIAGLKGEEPTDPTGIEAARAEAAETILLPIMHRKVEEFRSLAAPPGDEDRVKAIVKALEEEDEKAEKQPEQAVKYEVEGFGRADNLANEYGLSGC
ncbi:MAG TPA: hypothetical protein VN758_08115 [Solirubrobacterales bacterium]|nr:hypothetical protein [Solirubrobacterales bacterium]